jgi:hypothetical protein
LNGGTNRSGEPRNVYGGKRDHYARRSDAARIYLPWLDAERNHPGRFDRRRNVHRELVRPIVNGIAYVMNGGVNPAANPATYTVVSPTITLAAPAQLGYAFLGWTPAGVIPTGSVGARTFTANWSAPIAYDITYVLNGGTNAPANPATYTVESGLITLENPTRPGSTFLGWTPAAPFGGFDWRRNVHANWSDRFSIR